MVQHKSVTASPGTTEADTAGVAFCLVADSVGITREVLMGEILPQVAAVFPTSVMMTGIRGIQSGYWVGFNHIVWAELFRQVMAAMGVSSVPLEDHLSGATPHPTLKRQIDPAPPLEAPKGGGDPRTSAKNTRAQAFCRVNSDELSRAAAKEMMPEVAGTYHKSVMYIGFRGDGDGYWVAFNHDVWANLFCLLLDGAGVTYTKAFRLRGDNPNPDLKTRIEPAVESAKSRLGARLAATGIADKLPARLRRGKK